MPTNSRQAEMEFYLRDVRDIPKDDPDVPVQLRNRLFYFESMYRQGRYKRSKMKAICKYLQKRHGVYYRIIDDRNVVFLPTSNYVFTDFMRYPKILIQIAHRHGGKTVTAWSLLAWALEKEAEPEAWIYADVDGMAELLKDKPPFRGRLNVRATNDLPPVDGRKRFLLFNEVPPELFGKHWQSGQADNYEARIFRARHSYNWVIFNLIREKAILATIREGGDSKIFKRLTPIQLIKMKPELPNAYYEIIKMAAKLPVHMGLAMVHLESGGTYFHMVNVQAPGNVLWASENAEKRLDVMADDYDPLREKVIEYYGETDEKGNRIHGYRSLSAKLKAEGFTISKDRVNEIISIAREQGIEFPKGKYD